MVTDLIAQIKWLSANDGASPEAVRKAEVTLKANFSEDYRKFLMQLDGGNTRTPWGENICFFSTCELPEINAGASIEEFVPGWMIFASDRGGKSYLIRRSGDSERIAVCSDEEFSESALAEDARTFKDFLIKVCVG